MTKREMERLILELSARVKELEARPVTHYHYEIAPLPPQVIPVYVPQPQPYYPMLPTITCSGSTALDSKAVSWYRF